MEVPIGLYPGFIFLPFDVAALLTFVNGTNDSAHAVDVSSFPVALIVWYSRVHAQCMVAQQAPEHSLRLLLNGGGLNRFVQTNIWYSPGTVSSFSACLHLEELRVRLAS